MWDVGVFSEKEREDRIEKELSPIYKHEWKKEYKRLCVAFFNMTMPEAEIHFQAAPDFDFGYSPLWYVKEELNCEYIKRRH